jgi:hypothetical protein
VHLRAYAGTYTGTAHAGTYFRADTRAHTCRGHNGPYAGTHVRADASADTHADSIG